jgi:hypothetical protein
MDARGFDNVWLSLIKSILSSGTSKYFKMVFLAKQFIIKGE